jgi:hypothetical protein
MHQRLRDNPLQEHLHCRTHAGFWVLELILGKP